MASRARHSALYDHAVRILVVEDDAKVGRFVVRALTEEGYTVDLAKTGKEALDQAKAVALNEVREAMIDVARTLAEERGFNLLLPSSGLVLFSPQIDLTDDILARLDQKLPNVKVPEKVD